MVATIVAAEGNVNSSVIVVFEQNSANIPSTQQLSHLR